MFRGQTFLSLLVLGIACGFAAAAPAAPGPDAPVKKAIEASGAKAIRDKLSKPVSLEAGIQPNTSLSETLEFLSGRYEVTILVDTQAFKAEGIEAVEEIPVALPKIIGVKLST